MTSIISELDWNNIYLKNIEIEYKVPIINVENDNINKLNDLIYDIIIKKKQDGKVVNTTDNNINYKSNNISNIIKNILNIKNNKLDLNNPNLYNNYYKFVYHNNSHNSSYNCCLNEQNYNFHLKKWMIPIVEEKKNIYINTNYNCIQENEYMYNCNEIGLNIKIPNLNYFNKNADTETTDLYNKLNILSLKHLEEMIIHFDENGNRHEEAGLKLIIDTNSSVNILPEQINYQNHNYMPLNYIKYREDIIDELNNGISVESNTSLIRKKELIQNIEKKYLEDLKVTKKINDKNILPYLNIYKIDLIDIDENKFNLYINTYRENFNKQDIINQFFNKELCELEKAWHFILNIEKNGFITDNNLDTTDNTKKKRFNKFKKLFYLEDKNKENEFKENELAMFKQNNELIYKFDKIFLNKNKYEYDLTNKIKSYVLTDIKTGLSDISNYYNDNDWKNLTNSYSNFNTSSDNKADLFLDYTKTKNKLFKKVQDNINNSNNFINLFEELDLETKYSDIYNEYTKTKASNNYRKEEIKTELKNFKMEDLYKNIKNYDNFSQIYDYNHNDYDFFKLKNENRDVHTSYLYLHKPYQSNYIPVERDDNNYLNNKIKTQVLRESKNLSNITNIKFKDSIQMKANNYVNINNKIDTERNQNISSNSFNLTNDNEVRISLKDEYLNFTDYFYYEDPLINDLKINYIGDETTFLDKLTKINHKDLYKGIFVKEAEKAEDKKKYKDNKITLNELKDNFSYDKIIDKLLLKFNRDSKNEFLYLLNINSINNYLKDYDLNLKSVPSCFINKINYFLDLSTLKYKKQLFIEKKINNTLIINNFKNYNKKLVQKNYLEEPENFQKTDFKLTLEQVDTTPQKKTTYFIIQPPIIEAFLHFHDELINNNLIVIEPILQQIMNENQCWYFNGDNLEIIDNDIQKIFNKIIKQLWINNKKDDWIYDEDDMTNVRAEKLLFELLYDFKYDWEKDKFFKTNMREPFLTLLSNSSGKYTSLKERIKDTNSQEQHINLKTMIKIPIEYGSNENENDLLKDFNNYQKFKLKYDNKIQYYNIVNDQSQIKLEEFESNNILNETIEETYNIDIMYENSYKLNSNYNSNLNIKNDFIDFKKEYTLTNIQNILLQIKKEELDIKEQKIGIDSHIQDKNEIEKIYDCYKYFINPYNLVDDLAIKPENSSRAYTKLWEIIWPSNEEFSNKYYKKIIETNPKITFIAEAPGGFIYCLDEIRKQKGLNLIDQIDFDIITYDEEQVLHLDEEEIKLKPIKNKIQSTFLQKDFKKKFYKNLLLNIEEGISKVNSLESIKEIIDFDTDEKGNKINNSGNIINKNTLERLYNYYKDPNKKSDIITADGGTEIIDDYKEYEEIIESKLYFGEIITALCAQKEGGIFILKIKGLFYNITKQLLYILSTFYETIEIVKPYTSKVFNNEKYVKCYNFKGLGNDSEIFINLMIQILDKWVDFNINDIDYPELIFDNNDTYNSFITNLDNINNIIVNRQITNYNHLFTIIHSVDEYINDKKKLNILEKTINKADDKIKLSKKIDKIKYNLNINKIGLIFKEYCKSTQHRGLKRIEKIIKNQDLGKYIMYPLKMSLTLCHNINLKTHYKIEKYSENILYILKNINDTIQNQSNYIQLSNPYSDEIEIIENKETDNIEQFKKERYNFIDKNCYNITNNNYIKYNLYNEINNLKEFLKSRIEPKHIENESTINWEKWFNDDKDEFKKVFDIIINLLKTHFTWGINNKLYNNIINNIKKFSGWHLDKINFNKCFCRHYELQDSEYLDEKSTCIFCGTNFNNEENFEHEWSMRNNAEIETADSFMSSIIFHQNDISNIKELNDIIEHKINLEIHDEDNQTINNLIQIDEPINIDDIFSDNIKGFNNASPNKKEIIKEIIIIFNNLIKNKNIKNINKDRKNIIKNLLKIIQEIINNTPNSYLKYFKKTILNNPSLQTFSVNIKNKTQNQKLIDSYNEFSNNLIEEFQNLKEHIRCFKNNVPYKVEFNKTISKIKDQKYESELLKTVFNFKGGADDTPSSLDTQVPSQSLTEDSNSTQPSTETIKICKICGNQYIKNILFGDVENPDYKNPNFENMKICGKVYDTNDKAKAKKLINNSVPEDIDKLDQIKNKPELFEGDYHKFCYLILKNKIEKSTNKKIKKNQPIQCSQILNISCNIPLIHKIPNFLKKNNNKFIQFRENSNYHILIEKEEKHDIDKDNVYEFIYKNILYSETHLLNNLFKEIIFNEIFKYIYVENNFYIDKLSLIYYSVVLFDLSISENNKKNNYEENKNEIIRDILNNLIRSKLIEYKPNKGVEELLLENIIRKINNELDNTGINLYNFNIIENYIDFIPDEIKKNEIIELFNDVNKDMIENSEDDFNSDQKDMLKNNYINIVAKEIYNSTKISFYIYPSKLGIDNYDILFKTDDIKKNFKSLIENTYSDCKIIDTYKINNNLDLPNILNNNKIIFNNYNLYNHTISLDNINSIQYRGLEYLLNLNKDTYENDIRNILYSLNDEPISKYKFNIINVEPNLLQPIQFKNNYDDNIHEEQDYYSSKLFIEDDKYNYFDIKLIILKLKYYLKYIINLPLKNSYDSIINNPLSYKSETDVVNNINMINFINIFNKHDFLDNNKKKNFNDYIKNFVINKKLYMKKYEKIVEFEQQKKFNTKKLNYFITEILLKETESSLVNINGDIFYLYRDLNKINKNLITKLKKLCKNHQSNPDKEDIDLFKNFRETVRFKEFELDDDINDEYNNEEDENFTNQFEKLINIILIEINEGKDNIISYDDNDEEQDLKFGGYVDDNHDLEISSYDHDNEDLHFGGYEYENKDLQLTGNENKDLQLSGNENYDLYL